MKKTVLKEKSSVFIIGKGFIVIAIFITSSLSFTLGYFVGKSGHTHIENRVFSPPQQEQVEQKDIIPEKAESVTRQLEQSQKITRPEPFQAQQSQDSKLSKEGNVGSETKMANETAKISETREIVKPQEKSKTTKKIKYTVQVGAFKDASEADALREKLEKKGYKAYVIQSESKRNKKLFKVRIGEFNSRKEAEVLSIKIKKSEGLQTFATFKTEQEGLR